jgi:hypothetical protein
MVDRVHAQRVAMTRYFWHRSCDSDPVSSVSVAEPSGIVVTIPPAINPNLDQMSCLETFQLSWSAFPFTRDRSSRGGVILGPALPESSLSERRL